MKLRTPNADELHTFHWHAPCNGYGCPECGGTGMEYDKKTTPSQPPAAEGATARDVIAGTFWNAATAYERADAIIAALDLAGYHVLTTEQMLAACALHFMPRSDLAARQGEATDGR